MRFFYFLVTLTASLASAMPAENVENNVAAPEAAAACLPASCKSFGCCSGNCGYWCRACDIKYTC